MFSYSSFQQMPSYEQTEWFDELDYKNLLALNGKSNVKRFFRDIYEQSTDAFILTKAIHCICELTLLGAIRVDFTRDLLLDAPLVDSVFLSVNRLKYLFLLFGDDPDTYQCFEQDSSSEDGEIASEAFFRQGLVHLLFRANSSDESTFFTEIDASESLLHKANNLIENRLDARFFLLVATYLNEIKKQDNERCFFIFQQIEQLLWERQVNGWIGETDQLEWHIYRGLMNINKIIGTISTKLGWGDYYKQFSIIAKNANELAAYHSIRPSFKNSYESFFHGVDTFVLEAYYRTNLSARSLEINRIIEHIEEASPELQQYIINIKSVIGNQKKSTPESVEITRDIVKLYNHIAPIEIEQEVMRLKRLGKSDYDILTEILWTFPKQSSHPNLYNTGYSQGDKILNQLSSDLYDLVPRYPKRERCAFLAVLADLIRYVQESYTPPYESYSLLYDSTVKDESEFQHHLFDKLRSKGANVNAENYRWEDDTLIARGRIDIVYRDNNCSFPIEVKRDEKKASFEYIEKNYLAQSQSYAALQNGLGFFLLFDLSPNIEKLPSSQINSLFKFVRIDPKYPEDKENETFVLAVIVPANRERPSDLSNYKTIKKSTRSPRNLKKKP